MSSGAAALPALVTHTYCRALPRFRNLCAAEPAEAEAVLARFRAAGRRFAADYLPRRRATEAWLAEAAGRLLGPLPLARPLYFFLGEFDDGLDPARPDALVLPLSLFPPRAVTFTCGDSMAGGAGRAAVPQGRVFTLQELRDLAADGGLPATPGEGRRRGFVEMQLWDDAPLAPWR